jgi:competence protein ComEA
MNRIRTIASAAALLFATALSAAPPVDINTASAQALADAISGVGIKKAREIVRYRETNGPFASVEELVKVQGIGERTVEKSRERLSAGQAE